MERVLTTSELLDIIFFYTNDASKAKSSRVCRSWSDPALRSLWEDLQDRGAKGLLSLLSPIEFVSEHDEDRGRYKFMRDITDKDWEIFDRYASFVRRLTLYDDSYQMQPIYETVAVARPRVVLLPNLNYLRLDCDAINTTYSIMFLHSGLSQISIDGFNVDEEERMFRNIAERAPNIAQLNLNLSRCEDHSEDNLIQLLSSLAGSLRAVCLPKFFLTGRVMSALSKIPKLEKIGMALYDESLNELMEGRSNDLEVFKPNLAEEALSGLRRLEIASTLKDAMQLFISPINTSNLTAFYLNTPRPRAARDFTRLFKYFPSSCPSLETLFLATDDWAGFANDFELDKITMDIFRPLLKLANIHSFLFLYPGPIALVDSDLAEFGLNWKNLKRLVFTTEPLVKIKPSLTLAALEILAAHCPNLESLEIYIDASKQVPLDYPSSKFRRIKNFDFGRSPLQNMRQVAIYISQLCIECEDFPSIMSSYAPWCTISDMMHVALRVLKVEKERSSQWL